MPESTPIADLEIGDTADIVGVIRSTDPKRTFDRDDGSEGQVKNVRVQDETGDIRVALWGEKADRELAPGDKVAFADVSIKDGWADDIEASAGWQSTISVLDNGSPTDAVSGNDENDTTDSETGLGAFESGSDTDDTTDSGTSTTDETTTENAGTATTTDDGGFVEFTGTVVQAGNPVVLDDGDETLSVETDADVHLGQEVTARGERRGGKLDAEDVF